MKALIASSILILFVMFGLTVSAEMNTLTDEQMDGISAGAVPERLGNYFSRQPDDNSGYESYSSQGRSQDYSSYGSYNHFDDHGGLRNNLEPANHFDDHGGLRNNLAPENYFDDHGRHGHHGEFDDHGRHGSRNESGNYNRHGHDDRSSDHSRHSSNGKSYDYSRSGSYGSGGSKTGHGDDSYLRGMPASLNHNNSRTHR